MIHALHLLWIVPLVSCTTALITVAGMSVFMINALKPNMEDYPQDRIQEGNDENTIKPGQECCEGCQSEIESE